MKTCIRIDFYITLSNAIGPYEECKLKTGNTRLKFGYAIEQAVVCLIFHAGAPKISCIAIKKCAVLKAIKGN